MALRASSRAGFVVSQVPDSGSPPHGRRPVRGDPGPGAPGFIEIDRSEKQPQSSFLPAHPSGKNKDAARVGHPNFRWGTDYFFGSGLTDAPFFFAETFFFAVRFFFFAGAGAAPRKADQRSSGCGGVASALVTARSAICSTIQSKFSWPTEVISASGAGFM